MSKLGRYSANRVKIEALTAAQAKTVEVADWGTVFTCAGGNGVSAITLPSIATAGKGWWCKFVLIADNGTGAVTMTPASGDEDKICVASYGGLGDSTNAANVQSDSAADTVFFVASKALAGDRIEFICDGSVWLAQAFSADGDKGIDIST